MKKILTLICAVALVSGASAQVKQVRVDLGSPAYQQEKAFMPAASKAGEEETLVLEALTRATGSDGYFGISFSCTNVPRNDAGQPDWDKYYSGTSIWSPMGSAWASVMYGSGEFGYSLDFTPRSYYVFTLDRPYDEYGIVGAAALVGRYRTLVDTVNDKDMPLQFKVYSSPMLQVTAQKGYEDITSTAGYDKTVDCYFPEDPEKYVSLSNIVGVPVMEPAAGSSSRFGCEWFAARFETPALAGQHPCVSILFPRTGTGEDSLWNATLYEVGNMATGQATYSTSKFPAMYAVYDFKYQTLWGDPENWRDRVDHEYEEYSFIPDQKAQPNTRYAVVPMRSWNWTNNDGSPNGDRQDGEVAMQLIVANGVTMERGASYDKYVEVKINPAIDHTVIAATDAIKSVEIYNLSGKLVKTQACNSAVETISLNGLNSGMYIAKVTTKAGIANKKIMVR